MLNDIQVILAIITGVLMVFIRYFPLRNWREFQINLLIMESCWVVTGLLIVSILLENLGWWPS